MQRAQPDGNHFCSQCGAELGRSLEETARRNFRDRQVVEFEITQAVAERLMKWASWLGTIIAVIVALFALLIGKGYMDVRATVQEGRTDIANAVQDAKKNIEPAVASARSDLVDFQQKAASIKGELAQLQSDIGRYKEVNKSIADLQQHLTAVQGQVLDLSNRDLKVHTISTSGRGGASSISFGNPGCPPDVLDPGYQVAYCAQGSPLVLFQRSLTGDLRPVASLSPVGFQDSSIAPKPSCDATHRGTYYVGEKVP